MSTTLSTGQQPWPAALARFVDQVCDRFEAAWKAHASGSERPRLEDYLAELLEPERPELLVELIRVEVFYRRRAGEVPRPEDYQVPFPILKPEWIADVLETTPDALASSHPDSPVECPAGQNIAGHEILGVLGHGAMGVVYQARHVRLNRIVALKLIRSGEHAAPEALSRFRREAEAVAQLQHPHIVQIHEVGEHEGWPFFALEFVDGGSLAQKLAGTPQPAREAALLVETLARAIQHAHQRDLIHRDLKPANVLLTADGVPKIADFGLAKHLHSEPGASAPGGQTQSGAIVGTPSYMAPEQARGKTQEIGPAADVYALGAILYEALTGRPPFKAATLFDTLEQVCAQEPVPPRQLQPKTPRDLETICLKCLAKSPARRYPTAEALAEDLRRWLKGEPIQARPVSVWEQGARWVRRRPAVAALLASLFLVTVAGFALVTWQWRGAEAARRELAQADVRQERQLYLSHVSQAEREIEARNWGRAEELLDACPAGLRGWEWFHLRRRRHPPLTLNGKLGTALSPDGRLLALPAEEETQVWDLARGQQILTCRVPLDRRFPCLAFSPDSRLLALASREGPVQVWDTTAGTEVFRLHGRQEQAGGLAFSPDSQLLASAGSDHQVRLWDVRTRQEVREPLPGYVVPNRLVKLAFSPDGRRLAFGGENHTVKVWDVMAGQEVFSLSGHTDFAFSVQFSPDGKRLASTGLDNQVKVWDAETGRELFTLDGHSGNVWCVAFSPDSRRLAMASFDGTVRVHDATTGQLALTLEGHTDRVMGVAFHPKEDRIASASWDRTVKLWDTTTGEETLTLRDHRRRSDIAVQLAFSSDGRRLVSVSGDEKVRVWDAPLAEEDPEGQVLVLRGHTGVVYGVAYSPDGRRLASASADQSVKVWDAATGREIHTLQGHTKLVWAVAFSPDGERLASGSWDRTVRLWNVETGQEVLRPVEGAKGNVRSVAFSPDGRRLATCGAHQVVQLWDATVRKEPTDLRGHGDGIFCVAFSPDGKRLASTSRDRTVRVWDVQAEQEAFIFREHTSRVHAVAFSPDGRYLASGGADQKVLVWSADGGKVRLVLEGHTDFIWGMAFSPDGERLASASWGEVKVWDLKTGEVRTLSGHAGVVWSVAFSPDGKRLAAASGYKGRGEVKVWDVKPLDR
jgi:WD40 repeat protein